MAKKAAEMEGCVRSDKRITVQTLGGYKFHIIDEEKLGEESVTESVEVVLHLKPQFKNIDLYYMDVFK